MYVPPPGEFPGDTMAEKILNRRLAYICWTSWEDYATWEE